MAVVDSYITGDDSAVSQNASSVHVVQTFTPLIGATLTDMRVLIYRVGSPGTCSLGLYTTDADGEPDIWLGGIGFNGNAITTDTAGQWKTVVFAEHLDANTKYALRLSGGDNASNNINWRCDSTSIYTRGERLHSTDSGASYTHYPTQTFMFEINGDFDYVFSPPVDVITYKRLVAAAADTFWYEDI